MRFSHRRWVMETGNMSSFLELYCVPWLSGSHRFSTAAPTNGPKSRRIERVEITKTTLRVILILLCYSANICRCLRVCSRVKAFGSTGTSHNDQRAASVFNYASSTAVVNSFDNSHSAVVLTRSFCASLLQAPPSPSRRPLSKHLEHLILLFHTALRPETVSLPISANNINATYPPQNSLRAFLHFNRKHILHSPIILRFKLHSFRCRQWTSPFTKTP